MRKNVAPTKQLFYASLLIICSALTSFPNYFLKDEENKLTESFIDRILSDRTQLLFVKGKTDEFIPNALFVVNSVNDGADANVSDGICETATTGECTLRAAIQQANASAGIDTISFNISGSGVQTIAPASPLPDITQAVVIDGFTQPGASANTNPVSAGLNAVLLIEINGQNAGSNVDGLRLLNGGSTIRGLAINRFTDDGIAIVGNSDGNTIQGCYLGTNAAGDTDLGNSDAGIAFDIALVTQTPQNTLIGGTNPADRNLISGNNGVGIRLHSSLNTVQGNIIGLAANGVDALGNGASTSTGNGVTIGGAGSCTIGGATPGARNIISGNGASGISATSTSGIIVGNYIGTDISGTLDRGNGANGISFNVSSFTIGASGAGNLISGNNADGINLGNSGNNIVRGNFVGTQADGTSPLGNTNDGIEIFAGASNNTIGGVGSGEPNTIAFNGNDGVNLSSGTGNAIRANSIRSNGTAVATLGIDLGANGVTPNDNQDADTGANNLQNFPFISSVATTGATTTIQGTLNSSPNANFTIDFFSSASCDASGFGEGEIYLGSVSTTTDASGNSPIFSLAVSAISPTRVITATATDSANNTSEFSACAQEPGAPQTFTVNSAADDADGDCNGASGDCTLREAIIAANINASADTINFAVGSGAQTINVGAGGLPVVFNPVTIEATSQPGFAGAPLIELNGALAGSGVDGLNITAGNTTVKGLAINRFSGSGIEFSLNGGNVVAGNYIGTNLAGTSSLANGSGILINGVFNNRIGGFTALERNVVSGNSGNGIEIANNSTGNLVYGNYIGVNAAGNAALGNNGTGILIGSGSNVIGGDDDDDGALDGIVSARNIVSGNGGIAGIEICCNSNNNTVQGNLIGTDSTGAGALGNFGHGVFISGGSSGNQIGGASAGAGNAIAFNTSRGVSLNFDAGTGNLISSNSIFSNSSVGIDLGNNGVTPNDAGDADSGANNLQNFPLITGALPGSTRVIGTFNSVANTNFRLEFFQSPTADNSNFGEGQNFIGSLNLATDGSGNAVFDQTFSFNSPLGSFVSATATNLATGETSEFSNARQVGAATASTVFVGGRVMSPDGRGIRNVRMILNEADGTQTVVLTNAFGFYRFADISVGQTVTIEAFSKNYIFEPPLLVWTVTEETSEIDFVSGK